MIKSYCKINLSLKVLKKIKNGLHNIQSNIVLIDVFDEIKVSKINKSKDEITFKGQFKGLIKKNKNTISETMKILRKRNHIKSFYKIVINKKIPVFAGLGGGSSNSAFLIKYFVRKKINNAVINEFEKIIGSDLKVFFREQFYQKGLSKFINYKKKHKLFVLLVYPNIKCSTKEIYSKVTKHSIASKKKYTQFVSRNLFIKLMQKEKNDLQQIVEKKYPKIRYLINYIEKQKGCSLSRLTGSGSACFGIFDSHYRAKDALNSIKRKFPNYWSAVTKTI